MGDSLELTLEMLEVAFLTNKNEKGKIDLISNSAAIKSISTINLEIDQQMVNTLFLEKSSEGMMG